MPFAICSALLRSEYIGPAVRSKRCSPLEIVSLILLLCSSGIGMGADQPAKAQFARLPKGPPDSAERMEMVRVQVFLDRANFRPGKIDGLGGEFTQKAADRYCRANNLSAGSLLDVSSVSTPYREYTVTEEDLKWIGPQASEPAEQETLKAMLYADLWELVAERFHCDLDFLHELNPKISKPGAGTVFRVPDVEDFKIAEVAALEQQRREEEMAEKAAAKEEAGESPGDVSTSSAPESATSSESLAPIVRRLELLRTERLIELYEGDRLIGCFPCTPGSRQVPVPAGQWKVTANVLMPYFRWDKSVLENGVRSDDAYNLPPGPNNPVGVVWMAIDRPSVGMHGTNHPDQIGRNESHGCIRMANWDALVLSQLIEKGTPVEVK
jgi:hypothetical protein